jgi:pyruvate dehydrogenase E2 component (dihydrolipoamide acetyltransferase)
MAAEITMPKLSDTMEEGTLIAWRKSVGEKVERGDIIAEVETDKANMELEAFVSGILLETRFKAGDVVPVGTVIAIVGEAGEKPATKPPIEQEKEVEAVKKPAAEEEEAAAPEEVKQVEKTEQVLPAAPVEDKASPLVRRMAREKGIDLSRVKGTGPEGRILREDLEKFLEERGKPVQKAEAKAVEKKASAPVAEGKPQPFSRMRAAIARNVASSWRTIPHFSVTVSVDMGEAEMLQRGFREEGVPLSINDMIVKAAAMALQKSPQLNASFSDEGIILHPEINIGIAVSVEGGLLVPVVRGCERLSLKEISAVSRDLVDRARQGKISEIEISGGTFTVSNLGMFGVEEFTAVIYPTQAAILAVAAIRDTAVLREGNTIRARMMRVTLSADHRIVDGADAARFLSELRKILGNPYMMLV